MFKVFILLSLFYIYSFIGWIFELLITYPKHKKFVNRGFLIGPIVPIYGVGSLLITLLLTKYENKPVILFIMSILICSVLEYLTSLFMEKLFKTRWWDYSNKPFNINGRICLYNLLMFGTLALIAIYVLNPFFLSVLEKIDPLLLKSITSLLTVIFLIDCNVSLIIISSIKGLSMYLMKDSTEEINAKVKEIILNKGLFTRRIIYAFPELRIDKKIKK